MQLNTYYIQPHSCDPIYCLTTKRLKSGGYAGIAMQSVDSKAKYKSLQHAYPAWIEINTDDIPDYIKTAIDNRANQ